MSDESFQVVIAGGGVAALEATLALRTIAEDRVSIDLIAPEQDFVYRPLAVAEPFRVAETRTFPLAPLAAVGRTPASWPSGGGRSRRAHRRH